MGYLGLHSQSFAWESRIRLRNILSILKNSELLWSSLHWHIFEGVHKHHHRPESFRTPHCHEKLVTNFEITQTKETTRHFPPWILFGGSAGSVHFNETHSSRHIHTLKTQRTVPLKAHFSNDRCLSTLQKPSVQWLDSAEWKQSTSASLFLLAAEGVANGFIIFC